MGLIRSLLTPPQAFSRSSNPGADEWYDQGGWLTPASLGGSMNLALHLSAVMACTRAIAQPTAMVPLITYEYIASGGKRRAPTHPLYTLLHDTANPEMTAQEFREYILAHAFLRGTGYARIKPDPVNGQPVGSLVPIHSDYVTPERLPDGRTRYLVKEPGKPAERLLFDEVFKVRGLSVDGVAGVSFLEFARRTMSISSAVEEYHLRYYTKGGAPRGVLQHRVEMGAENRRKVEAEFAAQVGGVENSFKTPVLPPSLEWKQIGITNKDAQWLEGLQFNLGEYERWSGVPAHVIADLMRSTNNNIEEQAIEYVTYCLNAWGVRFEQSASRDLFIASRRYRPEHLWDALLKGRTKDRFEAYNLAWWMTINEKRERENMNPVDGGDDLIVPLNMGRLQDLGAEPGQARVSTMARVFALDAAKRMVTRELRAVSRAAEEYADDGVAWERWLGEFYAEHGRQLELVLHLPAAQAQAIAERHRVALLGGGVRVAEEWEISEVPTIAAAAIGEEPPATRELRIVHDDDGRPVGLREVAHA